MRPAEKRTTPLVKPPTEAEFLSVYPESGPISPNTLQDVLGEITRIEAVLLDGPKGERVLSSGLTIAEDQDCTVLVGAGSLDDGVMGDVCLWKDGTPKEEQGVVATLTVFPRNESIPSLSFDIHSDTIICSREGLGISTIRHLYQDLTDLKSPGDPQAVAGRAAACGPANPAEINDETAQKLLLMLKHYVSKLGSA